MTKVDRESGRSFASTRLSSATGMLGWLVPIGLLLVLSSNIIALFIPFLEIGVPFKRTTYSLPNSVHLMWEAKLYWVSILIVAFSIVFPLVKTVTLLAIWFLRMPTVFRNKIIRLLEALGKWSMLDIFVVILLMVLSNDQIFIETAPKAGLVFFIFAIIGNMLMSRSVEMIDYRLHFRTKDDSSGSGNVEPLTTTGWLGWVIPLLLLLAFVSIVVAVELPFLRINDALLHSYSYSVLQATQALFEQKHFLLGTFLVLFVGVAPVLGIAMMTRTWFASRTPWAILRRLEMIRIIGEWSMMSVFLLALGLIVTEGSSMVKTEMQSGVIAIAVSLVVCVVSMRLARWLIERRLRTDS